MPGKYFENKWNDAKPTQIKRKDGLDPTHLRIDNSRKIQKRKRKN